jgi:RNA polymerase sigma-70 factor, ECF subfamily
MSTLTRRSGAVRQPEQLRLLARAQGGDVRAFEDIAGQHVDRLLAIVLRLVGDHGEAEDVMQDALLRAWRGIGGFRRGSELFTWLYRIAVNEANRSLEKRKRRPETVHLIDEHLAASASPLDGPATTVERGELRAALEVAVRELPRAYRTAVVLRDIEGLSNREAADIAGIGEAAFKSRLHQARLKIRHTLGHEGLIAPAG